MNNTGTRKILYVYSGKAKPCGTGLDLVARQQVEALANAGHHVWFVARGKIKHTNVRNISIPLTPAIFYSASIHYYNAQNRFFSQLGAWIVSRWKFDAVISWTRQSRNLFRAANRRGTPCFLNCPGWHYNYPLGNTNWKIRSWPSFQKHDFDEEFARADALLVASDFARTTFLANGLNAEKVTNIGRGADPQRYKNIARPHHPFRAVFFGRVCDRKGIFQTLEAWKLAGIQDGELWIIGDVANEIAAGINDKLPVNVRLFGHRTDAETLLGQCHVQVLPTRQEGMAKTLVEGAACGLVTLATRESGFPVNEGETGFYIVRDEVLDTANRLRELAGNPVKWLEMSNRSSAFVQSHLTWPMFQNRFLAAVDGQLNRLSGISKTD